MRTLVSTSLLLATAVTSGCSGNSILDQGTTLWEVFPFNGERRWRYVNDSGESPFQLIGEVVGSEFDDERETNKYSVAYTTQCVQNGVDCEKNEEIRNVVWSSDNRSGVFIHAVGTGLGSLFNLENPIKVSDVRMRAGTSVTTETDGNEWTSTYEGLTEECPATFQVEGQCARFVLESDAAVDETGLAGTYWAAIEFNLVSFDLESEVGRWELAELECENCQGSW